MVVIRIALVICTVFVAAYFYVRYLEQKSLYYPTKEMEGTPAVLGLDYRDIVFSTPDKVTLHGWFVPAPDARCSVLFFHGNGGNISHRLGKIDFLHKLGANVFIVDYRGYGRSGGRPRESGLYQDASAAYAYLRDVLKQDCVIVYGESLGGAVAIDLALRQKVAGLVLEGTFSNVADMAKTVYPWLPAAVLSSKFDSLTKIASVRAPKLQLHAQDDDIVPFDLGKRLYETAGEPKAVLVGGQ